MLWKSCLGKSDKHLPPPPFPRQALICSHRNSDPGGNKGKQNPPNPSFKKNPKGGDTCTLELSFADQIWDFFFFFFLLGCEEHIARGRECLSKPLYPLILQKGRKSLPWMSQTANFHLPSKGALELLWEGSAGRQKVLLLLLLLLLLLSWGRWDSRKLEFQEGSGRA